MPTHDADGETTTSASPNTLDEPPHQRDRLALVAGVGVHLAAAGLLHREVDLVAEPLEQPHHRASGLGKSVSLKQVMNSATRMLR